MTPKFAVHLTGIAALCSVIFIGSAAGEETLVGTYGEVRTGLAFKLPEASVQKLVPEGWEPVPIASGPYKNSNLNVMFADCLTVQKPDGKPGEIVLAAQLVVPARKKGTEPIVPMIVAGLTSAAGHVPGPYGNFSHAKVTIDRHLHTDANGASIVEEAWEFIGDSGDKVQLRLKYVRGVTTRSKVETRVYSGTNPDFYHIYRFEQAVDIVQSVPVGIDRTQKVVFASSGPKFSQLFNGSEQLISITSLPFYSRQVALPGDESR